MYTILQLNISSNAFLFVLNAVLKSLLLILAVLICVAFLTAAERKAMSAMQQRKGPNVVGFIGLMQPIADGLKLFVKESTIPITANPINFVLAPILTFFLGLLAWAAIPVNQSSALADINTGIIYIFAISSLGVYGIIIAGWSSNSKYAFLGALRSAAQMVSYEVSIGLILINVLLCVGSLHLAFIVEAQNYIWFVVPLLAPALMFLISILAETNRAPFDLPEAEAELVSGYNVEYSAFGFALFFLGEYANMILMSSLVVVFFFGGSFSLNPLLENLVDSFIFSFKVSFVLFFFVWVRATFPRYRYDQLMRLGWKILLPLSFGFVLFTVGVLQAFESVPVFNL